MKANIDQIINETLYHYLNENLIVEKKKSKKKKKKKKDSDSKDNKKTKKKKKFSKNAIKVKGGYRKDFDVEDDELYNRDVDDQEQSSVEDVLNNGFINIKKVAQKLYPDHTPEGAQSQLRKKLEGERSDSGSKYKLKTKEVRRLRGIIASYLP